MLVFNLAALIFGLGQVLAESRCLGSRNTYFMFNLRSQRAILKLHTESNLGLLVQAEREKQFQDMSRLLIAINYVPGGNEERFTTPT